MPRIFHALAIALLIGSAVYVYKIKYDTMGLRADVARLEKQIGHERDLIALLKAEWQKLNGPETPTKTPEITGSAKKKE